MFTRAAANARGVTGVFTTMLGIRSGAIATETLSSLLYVAAVVEASENSVFRFAPLSPSRILCNIVGRRGGVGVGIPGGSMRWPIDLERFALAIGGKGGMSAGGKGNGMCEY